VKRAVVRPQAKKDILTEIRYYRRHAGRTVALRLIDALAGALETLSQQPSIGSPELGQELDIPELRTWDMAGFPLLLIYIERQDEIDVLRLLGQRQNVPALIRRIKS
jgi:toxin ParE1/3/4